LLFSCNAKDEAAVEPKPNEAVVDDVSENVNMEMDESLLAEKSLEKVKYDSSLQVGFAKKQSAPSAHQKYLKDKLVFIYHVANDEFTYEITVKDDCYNVIERLYSELTGMTIEGNSKFNTLEEVLDFIY